MAGGEGAALFDAGGDDWWGPFRQCRKLMSQNHESSCREITPSPPNKRRNPSQRDILKTKQMQREKQADWKWDSREQSLCRRFTSAAILFFYVHFSQSKVNACWVPYRLRTENKPNPQQSSCSLLLVSAPGTRIMDWPFQGHIRPFSSWQHQTKPSGKNVHLLSPNNKADNISALCAVFWSVDAQLFKFKLMDILVKLPKGYVLITLVWPWPFIQLRHQFKM